MPGTERSLPDRHQKHGENHRATGREEQKRVKEMAWDWINKIVFRIASEVHKSKIEEFEKRIMEMERKHHLLLKSMTDNERNINKIEERLYNTDMKLSNTVGIVSSLEKQTIDQMKELYPAIKFIIANNLKEQK